MKPMTTNEKNFAADNHDTLLRCLRRKHLPFSEFYDILVMGYIRAVEDYDRKELGKRYRFSTIANRGMKNSYAEHWAWMNRPKRKAVVVSLEEYDLDSLLPSNVSVEEMAEAGMMWDSIRKHLSPQQIRLVELRAAGYSDREIARKFQTKLTAISQAFDTIRSCAFEYCAD